MSEYIEQAEKFLADHNANCHIEFKEYGLKWDMYRNIYEVTIERDGKSYTFDFNDSVFHTQNGYEPNVYDVLSCLQKYEVGEYWDFCSEFGYENSEESWNVYNAVKDEYENVVNLFGDCMEEFQEIQ